MRRNQHRPRAGALDLALDVGKLASAMAEAMQRDLDGAAADQGKLGGECLHRDGIVGMRQMPALDALAVAQRLSARVFVDAIGNGFGADARHGVGDCRQLGRLDEPGETHPARQGGGPQQGRVRRQLQGMTMLHRVEMQLGQAPVRRPRHQQAGIGAG
jgi:hypothetical protein